MTMNQKESTTMNYSRTSRPMSAQQTLLKTKIRSTEGSGGSRMPNVPSAGGMQKPTHRTHLTAETSTLPSLQLMIASTTRQSGISLKQVTQCTIIQLDQRDPIPSLQPNHSRSEHHESSIPQVSRTPGGRPKTQENDNRHHN
jgi:hypothetical protein